METVAPVARKEVDGRRSKVSLHDLRPNVEQGRTNGRSGLHNAGRKWAIDPGGEGAYSPLTFHSYTKPATSTQVIKMYNEVQSLPSFPSFRMSHGSFFISFP